MNIYKEAQELAFANEDSLKQFFKKIRRDAEFNEYVSMLSAIHADLDAGMSMEDALNEHAPSGFEKMQMISLINNIGEQTFIYTDFPALSNALSVLRMSGQEPTGEVGVIQERQPLLTLEEVNRKSPKDVVAYFRSLEYPEEYAAAAAGFIQELEHLYSQLGKLRGAESRKAYRMLNDLKARLILLAEPELEQDEEGPTEQDLLGVSEEEPKSPIKEEKKPDITQRLKEGDSETWVAEEEVSRVESNEVAQIDLKTFSQSPIFEGVGDTIDFSVSPPVVNWGEIDKIYHNFRNEVATIYASASGGILQKKKPTTAERIELNMVMGPLKEFSTRTLNIINSGKEFEEDPQKIVEYDKLLENLKEKLPSQRILLEGDEEVLENLFNATICLGSFVLAQIILETDFGRNLLKSLITSKKSEKFFQDAASQADAILKMAAYSRQEFIRKLFLFLDLNTSVTNDNYMQAVSLKADYVFGAIRNEKLKDAPQMNYKRCPTCFKWIPWNPSRILEKEYESHELLDFNVRLFSLFRHDGTRITTADLTQDPQKPRRPRLFEPPSPSLFKRERERKIVAGYTGTRSWEQITRLLQSNSIEAQEEGWHRRAGALFSLGARPLVRNIMFLPEQARILKEKSYSKPERRIRNLMSKCPFGGEGKCGISFSNLDEAKKWGELQLQPTWNGLISEVSGHEAQEVPWESFYPSSIKKDEQKIAEYRKLLRGGYKFSKMNFACPCRINKVNTDVAYKFSTLAIPKTGPLGSSENEVYPRQPDGNMDLELAKEKGTISFMVCGAPTALSSFDRNPESDGYILKFLQIKRNTSPEEYSQVLESLIYDGIDFNLILELDSLVTEPIAIEKESYQFSARRQYLSKLLSKIAAVQFPEDSNRRALYEQLTLICPLGHKFTIKQSLEFGDKYIGLRMTSGFGPLSRRELIESVGEKNINQALSGSKRIFVPLAAYPEHTGLVYEEWKQLDPQERSYFPIIDKPEIPVLAFKIPDRIEGEFTLFVISHKYEAFSKENIWSPEEAYNSMEGRVVYRLKDLVQEVSITKENNEGRVTNIGDKQDGKQFVSGLGMSPLEAVGAGYLEPAQKEIPGSIIYSDDVRYGRDYSKQWESLNVKISLLSNVLKSVLKIIHVWTSRIATHAFLNDISKNYNPQFFGYESDIKNVLKVLLRVDKYPSGVLLTSGPRYEEIMREISQHALELLTQKSNKIFEWVRKNIFQISQYEDMVGAIAKGILREIFSETLTYVVESDLFEDVEVSLNINLEKLSEFVENRMVHLMPSFEQFAKEITLTSESYLAAVDTRTRMVAQLTLVSYAQYAAHALVFLNQNYFKEDSKFYIGYNIGVDLSSVSKIIGFEKDGQWYGGITEQDIERVISSFDDLEEDIPDEDLAACCTRIDRVYQDLIQYLGLARHFALTPKTYRAAKDYLGQRLAFVTEGNRENLDKLISTVFPTKTLTFTGTFEKPETSPQALPARRLPYFSPTRSIVDLEGTQTVSLWLLTERKTHFKKVFDSEMAARKFIIKKTEEEPDKGSIAERFIIQRINYYRNSSIGYEGNQHQVGMFGGKSAEVITWPPPEHGYTKKKGGFAGLLLPFSKVNTTEGAVSSLRDLIITDYQVVIDLGDGTPMDISFLFQRGKDIAQTGKVLRAEEFIIKALENAQENIATFIRENRAKISRDPDLLSTYRQQVMTDYYEKARLKLLEISRIPLRIRTAGTYCDLAGDKVISRSLPMLLLESPTRCYDLISHPEARGVFLKPEQQQQLIDFVIGVYNITGIRDCLRYYADNNEITNEDVLRMRSAADLPEKKIKGKFKLDALLKKETWQDNRDPNNPVEYSGWADSPGQFYSILPSESDSDRNTYVSYVSHAFPTVEDLEAQGSSHPTVQNLHSYIFSLRQAGLLESDISGNIELASRAQEDMLKYIEKMAPGKKIKKASDLSKKIFERERELERMILSQGILDLRDDDIPGI